MASSSITFFTSGQSASDGIGKIQVKGVFHNGKTWLRWVPLDYKSWQQGNQYGYQVIRQTVAVGGVLLSDSARVSANKLKFFRLAFGAAGGFGEAVDTREAKAAIDGLFGHDGRIVVGWLIEAPTLSKTAIKVLLNLTLIAGDALVRGGRLDIGAETVGGQTEIAVRAEGPRLVLDPELRKALTGEIEADALTPRAAAAWLVHTIATESGGGAMVSPADADFLLFGATLGGS